jgi:probable addiction module antidote protein
MEDKPLARDPGEVSEEAKQLTERSDKAPLSKGPSLDEVVKTLNGALARADATEIKDALGLIARERGMSQVARETGLARESLYRSLGAKGNPEFVTVLKVLSSIGLRLEVRPDEVESRAELDSAED